MRASSGIYRIFPVAYWLKNSDREVFAADLLGAAIVSFMFIPQSLAYALLAGLPVSAGLFASILPPIGYVLFGTSRALAVGPVAVISLMTASALAPYASAGTPEYAGLALILALLSGLMLSVMGILRLGFLSNFLSYPVVSGFVSASAILIAASQFKSILGIETQGSTLIELLPQLFAKAKNFNFPTLVVGLSAMVFLTAVRNGLAPALRRFGIPAQKASMIARIGPLVATIFSTMAVYALGLADSGVKIVGALPSVLPSLTIPSLDLENISNLAVPAFLISIIGFVESISVAQTFAAKRRDLVLPNNELLGLGASNIVASFCGAFPVSGGFSRSVVNYDAGVRTPIASVFTGLGIAAVAFLLAPVITYVPQAVLAATIIVAVLSLTDLRILVETWRYSRADFSAVAVTIVLTLLVGVEIGVLCGVLLSILMVLYRTSRPHMAVVGLVPDTEHFRNVLRHDVVTSPQMLSLRVDESLYFANAKFLEERVTELLLEHPQVKHLVLICSAINSIDASALESLEALNQRLQDMGVTFHLSEVKGPVMDRLRRSSFLKKLTGKVFLSQFHAVAALDPEIIKRAWAKKHIGAEKEPA